MAYARLLNQLFHGIPPTLPVLYFVIATGVVLLLGGFSALQLLAVRVTHQRLSRATFVANVVAAGLAGIIVLCWAWGRFVEPLWLETTHTTYRTDRLPKGTHFRIALVSDLHVEGWTRLLRSLPETVNAQHPELIVYTGDSINSRESLPIFREVLSDMHAPWGVYGIRGNHDYEWGANLPLFTGGVATELTGKPVLLDGGIVTLCGAAWRQPSKLLTCLDQAGPGLHIAAFHSPDLINESLAAGADVVLAGHTHGGQIRLPFYGAIVTMSAFGKKYEAGRFDLGPAMLYVTRGIGEEGDAPAVRFLCRPELTVIDVEGTGNGVAPAPLVHPEVPTIPPLME